MKKLAMLFLLIYCIVTQGAIVNRYSFTDGDVNAVDSVSGMDGTLEGTAVISGNQLVLDGSGAVNLPGDILDPSLESVTIEAWFEINAVATYQRLFDFGETSGGAGGNCIFYTPTSGDNNSRFCIATNGVPSWQTGEIRVDTTIIDVDTPTHIACVYDGAVPEIRLYQDGALMGRTTVTSPHSLSGVARMYAYIGDSVYTADPYFNGTVDEFRIYNTALADAEVLASFDAGPDAEIVVVPGAASKPNPYNDEPDVCREVVLSWTPGIYAPAMNGHRIFFSEDFNDVNEGVGGIIQDANTYTLPELPEWGTTYYWRVDEANSTAPTGWDEGDIWQFTVEPLAYVIENITATASSNIVGKEPINTLTLEGDLHSTNTSEMWLSDSELPGQAWIKYDFDKAYKLNQMWVWNYNGEFPLTWYGLNNVTIEYSLTGTDGDWTQLEGVPDFNQAPGVYDGVSEYAHNITVNFGGEAAKYVRIIANSNHSNGAFDNYGLSEVRFFYIPVRARKPSPDDEAPDVAPDVVLSWRAGREATENKVYFSSSEQAVTMGTITPKTIPVSGCEASYDPGGNLDLSTTYYWRIDEENGDQTWQGDVWSFTTADYLVVDDMEFYGDSNVPGEEGSRVFYVWRDGFTVTNPYNIPGNGTASQAGHWPAPIMESEIVHAGRQSMPFYYLNDGTHSENPNVYYSQITAQVSDLPIGENWTRNGVNALTLYFSGDLGNDVGESMWVKLTDQSDSSGRVTYGTYADEDVSKLTAQAWHEWNIELADFGVDLEHVKEISIGIGEPGATSAGGTGQMRFDDILLYPARCVPSRLKPAGDLNDDCVADYADLDILVEEWLGSGYLVTPQQPSATGLVAHYTFDGNANDSSGQGNDGSEYGGTYTTGKIGQAISFDGVDDYVELPIGPIIGTLTNCTVTTWVNFSNAGGAFQRIFDFGNDTQVYMFLTPRYGTTGPLRFSITTTSWDGSPGESTVEAANTLSSGWHHVAVTINGATSNLELYLDGHLVDSGPTQTLPPDLGNTTQNWLGRSQYWAEDTPDAYLMGMIDDFRIYDRVLTQAEIAGLAGRTETFSEPFDLNADGTVEFSDYAILADKWLDETILWPQL